MSFSDARETTENMTDARPSGKSPSLASPNPGLTEALVPAELSAPPDGGEFMDYQAKIARHVASIPRSGIRDFFELVQGRDDVISLGVGEPDFVTPWHIREAAIYSLEKGQTTYTSNLGLLSLRKAISRYVEDFFKVPYDPAREVLVTVGVSEAIDIALRALLNPGDEVIYHEPCYVSYSPSIVMAYGKAVAVETRKEHGFSLRPEALEKAITPRSRVLMLNFPTNPTGACATREDLEGIAKLAIKHDLIVLSDEIYSELRYDATEPHVSIASLPGMRERTVLLHGFSKAFAMTGFRLGYACAPQPIIEAMMKIHQYSMLCASIMSQNAAIEALENGQAAMIEMRNSYHQRRDFLVRRLNEIGLDCHLPGGAFYVFPDIRGTGLTSKEFALRLLEEESVACVPGSAFGASGEGFLRCCYATAFDDIRTATDRIEAFVNRL
ncbi:MAG: aminotransferase class I/II-fold pyridoxal phosphate-dependent enzyme [Luteolibacter sp.]